MEAQKAHFNLGWDKSKLQLEYDSFFIDMPHKSYGQDLIDQSAANANQEHKISELRERKKEIQKSRRNNFELGEAKTETVISSAAAAFDPTVLGKGSYTGTVKDPDVKAAHFTLGNANPGYLTTNKEQYDHKIRDSTTAFTKLKGQQNFPKGKEVPIYVSNAQQNFVPHDVKLGWPERANAKAKAVNFKKAHFNLGNENEVYFNRRA